MLVSSSASTETVKMKLQVLLNVRTPDYQVEPGTEVVAVDANYFRPTEVELLIGDPEKAKRKLGMDTFLRSR